ARVEHEGSLGLERRPENAPIIDGDVRGTIEAPQGRPRLEREQMVSALIVGAAPENVTAIVRHPDGVGCLAVLEAQWLIARSSRGGPAVDDQRGRVRAQLEGEPAVTGDEGA